MRTLVDDRFKKEAATYDLRFSCPDCVYFDDENQKCSEGYPPGEHLSPLLDRESLLFCKLFEGA